jgi:hypothetical protein
VSSVAKQRYLEEDKEVQTDRKRQRDKNSRVTLTVCTHSSQDTRKFVTYGADARILRRVRHYQWAKGVPK